MYNVATKTLWQKGYDKTSIRDIAKATDMTAAGLYYYFKSKEGLSTDNIAVDAHCLVGKCVWLYRWHNPKGKLKHDVIALKLFETFLFGLSNKRDYT